ncbi:Pvc16 family protein [Parabacteroides sp. APC149_11_2_Y6]
MIKKILSYYASRLDEYLSRLHHQPEGLAEIGVIGNSTDEKPCKLIVSLINIERETAGGISSPMQRTTEGYIRQAPPLLLNLNLMLAAVYDEKRYAESLDILSDTLKFIQSVPIFEVDGMAYTVEIVTLSSQDLNNIWTMLGGQYYPSVVCKLRRLVIDAEEITGSGATMKQPDIKL